MKNIKKFFKKRSGASAVEYALLVALIGMVLTGSTSALGTSISSALSQPSDVLASTPSGGSDPGDVAPATPKVPTSPVVPSAPQGKKSPARPFF